MFKDYLGVLWNSKKQKSKVKFTILLITVFSLNLTIAVANTTISSSSTILSIVQQGIKGKVLDNSGVPVAGANVKNLTSKNGVTTDFDGNFSLNAKKGDVLEISFIGMKTKAITVQDESTLKVVMENEASTLGEVVVVGFASQKKGNVSSAVSTKKMGDVIGNRPIVNTGAALQGAFGGLLVTVGTGRPGVSAALQIRGIGSINGGTPLYVVNNVPIGSIDNINPNDIETVSVLKDAAASSIYGARASFGVILITTKSGKRNQVTKVDYTTSTSFDYATELPKKASIYDFVTALSDMQWGPTYWTGQNVATWKGFVDEYKATPTTHPYGYAEALGVRYPLDQNRDLAGEDFYGGFAYTTMHNLSVTGGGENSAFRISGGFSKQDGIIVTDNDSFRKTVLNTDYRSYISDKLTLDLNMNYLSSYTKEPRGSYYNYVTFPTFANIGSQLQPDGSLVPYNIPGNAERYLAPVKTQRDNLRLFSKLEYKPIKSLSIIGEYTYEYSTSNRYALENIPLFANSLIQGSPPALLDGTAKFSSLNTTYGLGHINATNLYATYKKNLGNHNFQLMAGYNMEMLSGSSLTGRSNDLIDVNTPTLNLYTGTQAASDSRFTGTSQSYFTRFNYNFNERYFVEFNVRRDGSSKFPITQHWGVFPSTSVAWNVTNENFMKDIPAISLLKLRASYGEIGNQNIGNYGFFGGLSGTKSSWVDPSTNLYTTTLTTPALVRQDYTWERVRTTNYGVDLGFLNSRFTTSFDLFKKQTLDMLSPSTPLPSVLGTNPPSQNAADLEVNGWELEVKWRDKVGDLSYYAGFNLSDSQGKITRYLNPAGLVSSYYVGQKIGEIWGNVSDSYYTTADFVAGSLNASLTGGTLKPGVVTIQGTTVNPGDTKYQDLNGNGIIENGNGSIYVQRDANGVVIPNTGMGDRKIIGNSTNRFQYGANFGMDYKGWDLSAFIQGVGKRELWVGNEVFFPLVQEFGILYDHQKDYWTPTNTDAYYPRNYYKGAINGGSNRRVQTKYLANGAYVRLKNITLGYTLPATTFRGSMIHSVKVFFSGENLFNFDHLPDGLNATFDDLGNGGTYPSLKQYSFGVNVSL